MKYIIDDVHIRELAETTDPIGRHILRNLKPLQPMTDEQIKELAAKHFHSHHWNLATEFARAIEKHHFGE